MIQDTKPDMVIGLGWAGVAKEDEEIPRRMQAQRHGRLTDWYLEYLDRDCGLHGRVWRPGWEGMRVDWSRDKSTEPDGSPWFWGN